MFDLTLVVPPQNKGWILDRIANVIKREAERYQLKVYKTYDYAEVPESRHVYALHYSIISLVLALNPGIKKISAFFTHTSVPPRNILKFLKRCECIITENEEGCFLLSDEGVEESKIHIVPEGTDPEMFQPHRRSGEGKILTSSAWYPRKNSEKYLEVVKALPNKRFKIVGKNWEKSPCYKELSGLPNLEIIQGADYEDYPSLYEDCDVYLSLSRLEGGGPNGLIEAMMSNIVPVVTDTGNAREYIKQGFNGFVVPIDFELEKLVQAIEAVYTMDCDVRKTVEGFTWSAYGKDIVESLFPNLTSQDGNESIS